MQGCKQTKYITMETNIFWKIQLELYKLYGIENLNCVEGKYSENWTFEEVFKCSGWTSQTNK